MTRGSGVGILAALGGILIVIGGFLGFFLNIAGSGYGPPYSIGASVVVAAVAILLGIVILIFSGFTRYRGAGRGLAAGISFLILGILTWLVAGRGLLVLLGAILTIIAGLVLVVMILMGAPNERR